MSKKPKYHRPPHGLIIDFLNQGIHVRPKKSSDGISEDLKALILALALKDAISKMKPAEQVMFRSVHGIFESKFIPKDEAEMKEKVKELKENAKEHEPDFHEDSFYAGIAAAYALITGNEKPLKEVNPEHPSSK